MSSQSAITPAKPRDQNGQVKDRTGVGLLPVSWALLPV
jgi:hypothetical protein